MKGFFVSTTILGLLLALSCSEREERVAFAAKARGPGQSNDYSGDVKIGEKPNTQSPPSPSPDEVISDMKEKEPSKHSEEAPAVASGLCKGNLQITGGNVVKPDSVMKLSTVKIKFESNIFCTGTLIGPKHLVAAAHCVKGEMPTEVRFGINPESAPDLTVPVKSWIYHPDYNGRNFDVAIVMLKNEVPAQFTYAPLAKAKMLKAGMTVYYAGYGSLAEDSKASSNTLYWTAVKIDSIDTERRSFSTEINGKGSCYGDSGGPGYIIDTEGSCLLAAGVVNTASVKGNGICGQGDTSFDMTQALGWISDSFKILSAPLPYKVINDGTEAAVSRDILGTR